MASVPHQREWLPITQLREEVNRLFNSANEADTSSATASWVPAVDVHEFDDRFSLFVDLPGVEPSAVDITLENGVLSIGGERSTEGAKDERGVRTRLERGSGRFYRRFILPDSIDTDQVKAAGRHGVLEIQIQKRAKAQPRRIKVS
jgi:HSP20 family protein